jgi:hypothetical protein
MGWERNKGEGTERDKFVKVDKLPPIEFSEDSTLVSRRTY